MPSMRPTSPRPWDSPAVRKLNARIGGRAAALLYEEARFDARSAGAATGTVAAYDKGRSAGVPRAPRSPSGAPHPVRRRPSAAARRVIPEDVRFADVHDDHAAEVSDAEELHHHAQVLGGRIGRRPGAVEVAVLE